MRKVTNFVLHCIKGLERMYIASEHIFSASYKAVDGKMVNLRGPNQYQYSMNTLMGLHKAQGNGSVLFLDVESDYQSLAAQVAAHSDFPERIAATIWTGRCLGLDLPSNALSIFRKVVENAVDNKHLTALGLAWIIAACAESGEEYQQKADEMVQIVEKRYLHAESTLIRHVPMGFRKDWASFAASCYTAYSLLLLARKTGNEKAKRIGLRIARALVGLQGPQGQWAWFYHIPSGKIADNYPVYSVHQRSMAPFFLLECIDQGYPEFREPLLKGFRWVLGQNEAGQSMVDTTHRVIWRSLNRKGHFSRLRRFSKALVSSKKKSNSRIVGSKDTSSSTANAVATNLDGLSTPLVVEKISTKYSMTHVLSDWTSASNTAESSA